MRQIGVILLLVVLLAACSQQSNPINNQELSTQANSWQKLGGALDYTVAKDAVNPQLVLDRQGNLVAAWAENNNGWKLYLERWSSTGWQSFGAGFPMLSADFSLAFDSTNKAVVGASAAGGKLAVYRREAAGVWKLLGSPFVGGVTANTTGAIYSVLHDGLKFDGSLPAGKNLIRRWNGSSWQTVYTFQERVRDVDVPVSFFFTQTGKPAVSWVFPAESQEKERDVWNGTAWVHVASFRNFGILDKVDKPLAVNTYFENGRVFLVILLNNIQLGSDFNTLAFFDIGVDNSNRPILALADTTSTAANKNLLIKRWTGSAWVNLGAALDRIASRDANSGRVLVDKAGTLYAIWRECAEFSTSCTNHNVYVSKYVP